MEKAINFLYERWKEVDKLLLAKRIFLFTFFLLKLSLYLIYVLFAIAWRIHMLIAGLVYVNPSDANNDFKSYKRFYRDLWG